MSCSLTINSSQLVVDGQFLVSLFQICTNLYRILTWMNNNSDGKFGLWIDASFEEGYSTRCLTFDNQVLSGPEGARPNGVDEGRRFQVNRVEVWRVGQ